MEKALMPKTLRAVLYVDDEPDIRQIVQIALGLTNGLTVSICESGIQALELAHTVLPDLLLLDVMMPGLDGPGTLRRVRADPAIAHIPVIFMTAKAMPREIAQFHEMGAIGVIAKPFDPMQLSKQVFSLWKDHANGVKGNGHDHEGKLQSHVTQLGKKFLQRTRDEAAMVGALIKRAHQGDASVIPQLERVAHKIHGSGSMFGFRGLSVCAGEIEHLVEGLKERDAAAGTVMEPDILQRLIECGQRLAQEVESAAADFGRGQRTTAAS